ncbi:MAG: CPBP family intramembrane glutamic endopeptidase [Alphaproteobacteria bacterium]
MTNERWFTLATIPEPFTNVRTVSKHLVCMPFFRTTAISRNLLDIIVIAAFSVAIGFGLELFLPKTDENAFTPLFAVPLLSLGVIWILLRLRGQRFADIGLGAFGNVTNTVLLGVAIAAALWVIAAATEAAGFVRNLDNLRSYLRGDFAGLALMVAYAFGGAGLYEEVTFRGFVMHRVAHMFGATTPAWLLGALAQGILFALAHVHQGVYGMAYTGALSVVLALVLLATGRNLWPLVIGHGLYDATRFAYFYVVWNYA